MITPCIATCKIDQATRQCIGCGRFIDEIRDWTQYSDAERMEIMKRLGYANKRSGREEKLRRYIKG